MYSEQKQALAAELNFKHPAVLAVSGAKGCGKTTLLAALLPVLKARGLKVGVIRQAELDAADLLTEEFRLNEQDLLALFERHSYDLVLLEGFNDSGWPKIEVIRKAAGTRSVAFQPMAVAGDVPGADFPLDDLSPLADWIENQMPAL